jgi:formamidopyrimidine-DNA glycosylase
LSRRSLATNGITVAPEAFAEDRAARIPRRFARHYVYGRVDQPCRACARPITRETIAARPFYACRHCQR